MKRILLLMMTSLLIACSNLTGQANFKEQIEMIEEDLASENWQALQEEAAELKKLYKDQQWKLQLLGDEGEYEGLNMSINRLFIAIEEKDRTEAKLELANIQSLIADIYSL